MSLKYLYLDLNSFFASCEQQEDMTLRGKPVGVVPLHTDSTAILAASYEAKAFGVKTGTGVGDAKQMCPGIKLVLARHGTYVKYHHAVLKAVETCVPIEKVCSIDEVLCRLTGDQQLPENAMALALKIKRAVREHAGVCLTSSIGLAPNPFLAKIAADMRKPDGLTVLLPEMLPQALYHLDLRDMLGVGPRMEARLNRAGIHDVESLCNLSAEHLRRIWGGVTGLKFYLQLHGHDVAFAPTQTRAMSHQHVLEPAYRTRDGGLAVTRQLLMKGAERMRTKGYYCKHLGVQAKLLGHEGYYENSASFSETQDTAFLLQRLEMLWRDYPKGARPLRVGILLSGLVPVGEHQLSLFNKPRTEKLLKAVDAVNQRFGRHTLTFGLDAKTTKKVGGDKIAFQRVPEEYTVEERENLRSKKNIS